MNKRYNAVLVQNVEGQTQWAVECEHVDDNFRVEIIARCNPTNAVVGNIWAQKLSDAMNLEEKLKDYVFEHRKTTVKLVPEPIKSDEEYYNNRAV
jgi:hypothetical protein